MSAFDTVDGAFMNFAYSWAFLRPIRKVFYTITITTLSVLVALVIGPLSLASVLADKFDVEAGPIGFLAGIDLQYVGYAIVAAFVLAWALAVAVWRFGRIEERWSARLKQAESSP
jgi:high-affinity nickel-transport protein